MESRGINQVQWKHWAKIFTERFREEEAFELTFVFEDFIMWVWGESLFQGEKAADTEGNMKEKGEKWWDDI